MTNPTTEPSEEALATAREAYRQGKYHNDVIGEFALALDRFRAAGVREERKRCASLAFHWLLEAPTAATECVVAVIADEIEDGLMTYPATYRERELLAVIDHLTQERDEARRNVEAALEVLRAHHDWHLQSGTVGLPDGDGGWIEIDNALEYSDGTLCSKTISVLSGR